MRKSIFLVSLFACSQTPNEEIKDIEISECGDCVNNKNEECDMCLYDGFTSECTNECILNYNPLPQMDCNINWLGVGGCDQEEADLYCRILTKNINAKAKDFILGSYISTRGLWTKQVLNTEGIPLKSVEFIYPNVFYYEKNPFNTLAIHTMTVPNCFIE